MASLEYASTFAYCTRYTTFWTTLEQTGDYTFRLTTEKPYSLALYDLSSNAACVLLGILAGVIVYGVLVIALRILRAEDVRSIPRGEKLIKLLHLK